MRTISVEETAETAEDMAEVLLRIAEQISEGYTSGYEPVWSLEGEDEDEILHD